ncbi:MAG: Ig-like domain-containing protein [bacterium]
MFSKNTDKKFYKKKIYLLTFGFLIGFGFFLLAKTALAQFGLEYATASGLGTRGLKQTVFTVINVLLGFLGIVALVIVMYGGFVWMTAGGNQEKVSRAKKILLNGLIGLLLILTSWGIANFVLGQLWGATGGGGPTPGSPCDCVTELGICSGCLRCQNTGGPGVCTWQNDVTCDPTCFGLPGAKTFYAQKFQPTSPPDAIRNAVVRITFKGVNTSSQPGAINYGTNFSVIDVTGGNVLVNPDAAGSYPKVVGNRLEFKPDTNCPPPNASYKCFNSNNDYQIVISNLPPNTAVISNTAGININCILGAGCQANFRTNDIVDTTPPQISVSTLSQICAGTTNTVYANGKDDSGIAYVEFYYDDGSGDALIDTDNAPNCLGVPPNVNCSAQVNWDTSGDPDLVAGGTAFLKAKAMDLDSNEGNSANYKVTLRAAHCCNSIQDMDEEAIDCGGTDCAACAGANCDIDMPTPGCQPDDMVCASIFCDPSPGPNECKCQQPPIIDWVQPAGGFCDGSINTPCNDNADCSTFIPNTCNNTDPNGRPGNFVTIGGRFFGTTSGTVNFRGAAGWIMALPPISVNPACPPDTWTDHEIVVAVPNGVVNGPIQVETAAGYTDQTADTRGPLVPDFLVNTITRPGLCQAAPNSGPYATLVNLTGVRFGPAATSRTIEFGNETSFVPGENINWINNENANVTVPNLRPADVGLRIKTDDIYSNYLSFRVLPGTAGGPYISYLDPVSGPVGQYMTIFGGNFGNQVGTVKFIDGGANEVNADVNFPSECLNNFWHNNYIIVKVPSAAGVNDVKVITQAGKESNVVPFTITAGTPGPGICALIPDNGPVGTTVDFFGDNFGGALGQIIFHNSVSAPITSWANQSIKSSVPLGAVTGPVFARRGGQPSNQVPFRVGACQDSSQCQAGEECCEDKTCRITCPEKVEAIYGWSFTTGDYFVAQNCIRDIEIPATGPKGGNICVNAQIAVRFTTTVNDASVPPNVVVERCDNDECTTVSPVAGNVTMVTLATDPVTEGFTFTPSIIVLFDTNTTYRVTLRGGPGGIEDESGTPLIDDFSWTFKTRNDGRQCEIDKINVAPNNSKLVLMGATQDYVALITAKEDPCLLIDPKGYTWAWESSKPEVAQISGFTVNTATAVAMGAGSTDIIAKIPSENKSGKAILTVDLSGLQVLNAVPKCDTTCTNAQIRARFSNWVDDNTLAGNLFIYQCPNKVCGSGFTPVALNGANPYDYFWNGLTGDSLLDINQAANFNPNTFYRVIIKGGPAGIKNYLGGGLSNPNYKSSAGEECEPPGFPGCSASCLHTSGECTPGSLGCNGAGLHTGSIGSSCGNGAVEPARGENCDPSAPGYGPSGCDSTTCLLKGSIFPAICGDSSTPDRVHGEACDDRNQTAGDGCSPKCLREGTVAPICGDGNIDLGEDCDDGNITNGDGCSAKCLAEGAIGSVCGDRRVGLGEDCDDGNTAPNDGCSGSCLSEGATGLAVCGNNVVEDGKINDSYSWVFGVGNAICQPLRSEVVPANLTTIIGKTIDYLANVYSLADECSPTGQLLDADDYPWEWTTNNAFVADFDPPLPLPPHPPRETVKTLNVGNAQICASADTTTPPDGTYDLQDCADIVVQNPGPRRCQQSGNACCANGVSSCEPAYKCLENQSLPACPWSPGFFQDCLCCCDPTDDKCPAPLSCYADKAPCAGANRGLCCGCKQDSECPDPIGEGCGSDKCCHSRPAVAATLPANNDANICRNLKIRVDFDPLEPMQTSSFVGKVEMIKMSDSSAVKGMTSSAGNTILYFSPQSILEPQTQYRVTIKKEVLSIYKVAMAADYIFSFTTGDIICEADYLKVSIQHDADLFVTTNKDLFTCAKTSGCIDDTNTTILPPDIPDNQHLYLAEAMDMTGVVLTGYDYNWQTTDPDDIVNPNTWALNSITVTANNKKGRTTYNVKATPQLTSGNTAAVSNYVYVTNFICENPWPAVNNWPWIDDSVLNPNSICNTPGCFNVNTQFQIMYCRDAGGPGPADDLPELKWDPPLIPGQSGNLLKEFYFVVP